MPKTLADATIRLAILTTEPANMSAITVTELNAGIDASCRVLKSDYRMSPTASDTVADTELCSEGNAVTYGASNYEASLTPFWYLDEQGKSDMTEDVVYQALREKGTRVWLVQRQGPKYTQPWAVADVYDCFEVVTDNPQQPSDMSGYIKRTVPLGVQRAVLGQPVAAGGGS
jgi:hypothetical protein